jgi:hypothetical protein
MTKLEDRDLDRLLDTLDHQPDTWRLQILKRQILAEVAARKARPFFMKWSFEPALVAAMLLGLVLGSALPFEQWNDGSSSIASILQLSGDSYDLGG